MFSAASLRNVIESVSKVADKFCIAVVSMIMINSGIEVFIAVIDKNRHFEQKPPRDTFV